MKLKITVKDLKKLKACQSGIDEFIGLYGQSADIEWTKTAQIALLKTPMRKYISWAYLHGLFPWWSMSYADLRYADLSSADLRFADLRYADLRYADLSYADLRFADLRYANLSSANLCYADLCYADLCYADLRSANTLDGLFIDKDPKISGYKFENSRLWRDQ